MFNELVGRSEAELDLRDGGLEVKLELEVEMELEVEVEVEFEVELGLESAGSDKEHDVGIEELHFL